MEVKNRVYRRSFARSTRARESVYAVRMRTHLAEAERLREAWNLSKGFAQVSSSRRRTEGRGRTLERRSERSCS
jgi:hypothetical protein